MPRRPADVKSRQTNKTLDKLTMKTRTIVTMDCPLSFCHFKVLCTKPYMYCKVFEDNSDTLKLARLPKLFPRTKHINVCYHHFCKHVRKGLIKIFPIDTKDWIADAQAPGTK
jgi:hypothetical protein